MKKRTTKTNTRKNFYEMNKTKPNYKDVLILSSYLTEKKKIKSTSNTGTSSKVQRQLAREIKKARYMGLLPYTDLHSQL